MTNEAFSIPAAQVVLSTVSFSVEADTTWVVVQSSSQSELEEREYFHAQFREANFNAKGRLVEDSFWTLFNSPEFAWSH